MCSEIPYKREFFGKKEYKITVKCVIREDEFKHLAQKYSDEYGGAFAREFCIHGMPFQCFCKKCEDEINN